MATIKVRNESRTIDVPDGSKLLEYLKNNSSMLFGCENGECGTCNCAVTKGMENLNPLNEKETKYFGSLKPASKRLACQLWIKKGEVEIEY